MEEFNLTEKKLFCDTCKGRYLEEDVKEFIKRIKEPLIKIINKDENLNSESFVNFIDKLAGDKLL